MATNAKLETAAPFRIGAIRDVAHFVLEHDAPAQVIEALRADGAAVRLAGPPGT